MKFQLVFFILILLMACDSPQQSKPISGTGISDIQRDILKVNSYILKRNRDHIRGFIRRTGWDMIETGSGLFYMINSEGSGNKPVPGQTVILDYELRLIDGELISSSEREGPMRFTSGQGSAINALEEAVLLMREGGEATIIVLPHLAYGNFGDVSSGIPPDAILIYWLKLNKVI